VGAPAPPAGIAWRGLAWLGRWLLAGGRAGREADSQQAGLAVSRRCTLGWQWWKQEQRTFRACWCFQQPPPHTNTMPPAPATRCSGHRRARRYAAWPAHGGETCVLRLHAVSRKPGIRAGLSNLGCRRPCQIVRHLQAESKGRLLVMLSLTDRHSSPSLCTCAVPCCAVLCRTWLSWPFSGAPTTRCRRRHGTQQR